MIDALRQPLDASFPASISIAEVQIAVRGHNAFTAIPSPRNSSAMPNTHIDIPYFAIV
jgi:hypothetical protein